jgi:hypothetical protein
MFDDKFSTHGDVFFYSDLLAKTCSKILFLKVIFKTACVTNFVKIRLFPTHITPIGNWHCEERAYNPPRSASNPSVFVTARTSAVLALSNQWRRRTKAGIQHAAPRNKLHRLSYQLEYWLSERPIRGNFILWRKTQTRSRKFQNNHRSDDKKRAGDWLR